jgi:hypothetical protein
MRGKAGSEAGHDLVVVVKGAIAATNSCMLSQQAGQGMCAFVKWL